MSFQSRNRSIPQNLYVSVALPRPSLRRRVALALAVWRERVVLRRRLAEMDVRCLRELGISPAAAAYESGRPFWRRLGTLR
ncbi:MAG: hypothetical protein JSR47_14775 [Proteobacteria bacterium]|nr:hypothetical protein [Pseudomonadota bacterium]